MLRDAVEDTADMKIVEHFDLSVLNRESLQGYRNYHRNYKPEHVFHRLSDEEYLIRIGAAARKEDGKVHPTIAGLLMFGDEYNITRELPEYFLDYREMLDPTTRWTDRVQSSSGDWTGNIQDFFFRVNSKIAQDIKIENPGSIRIGKKQMLLGGISDPRNKNLMKMFNLLGIGERAGGGIPDIYQVWADQGWNSPVVEELYNPDRTRLSLDFSPKATKKTNEENKRRKQAKKTSEENKRRKTEENYVAIKKYLKQHGISKTTDIAAAIELSPARTRVLLKEIPGVYFEGTNTNRKYYLIEE